MDKIKNDSADEYLDRVIKRLETEYFDIKSNISYKNQYFEYVARRRRFRIVQSTYFSTIFLFSKFSSLDTSMLRDFSSKSFKYAMGLTKKPLPFNLFYGRFCYPVAIVDKIDYLTSRSIRKKAPPKHWLAFEMPVIYSLETGKIYYCEVTPFYGGGLYDEMRHTINYMLAP